MGARAVAAQTFTFDVGTSGRTSAAIYPAKDPAGVVLILAHGAGAPRTHPFMTDIATRIATFGVEVITFNFLYAEAGKKLPDRVDLLEACWRAAIAAVRARGYGGLLYIGGKSMGGRIATHIAGTSDSLQMDGVVLLGYPLHPMGKPHVTRREILDVDLPMLVVQGTRDELGTSAALKRVLIKKPNATVLSVRGADHALKASDVIAEAIATFVKIKVL